MPNTKRIVLNLTSAEYEALARAVTMYCDPDNFLRYPDEWKVRETLAAKMQDSYEKWGCP
jgi:hypothetical protein